MNTTTVVTTQIQISIHFNICATTHSPNQSIPQDMRAPPQGSRNQQSVPFAKVAWLLPPVTPQPLCHSCNIYSQLSNRFVLG